MRIRPMSHTASDSTHKPHAPMRARRLVLPTMVSVIALTAGLEARADAFIVGTDQTYDYTGTVNGTPIPGFTSTPGSTSYPGPDGAIFLRDHAPPGFASTGNANSTNFEPNWFASLNGLNNGSGNPSNSPVGWVSLFDPTNSGFTSATGTWNASHTVFTMNVTGTTPNDPTDLSQFNRVWAPTGTNTGFADQQGYYTNYNLTLTANFAPGTVTETNPFYDWFSTTAAPTSITGSFNGTFVNNSTATPANNGTYNVALNFNNLNWAANNGIADNGSGGAAPNFGATDCPSPTASCNIVFGTTGTSGTPTGQSITLTNTVVGPNALQAAIGGDGYDGFDDPGFVAGGNGGDGTSNLTIGNVTSAISTGAGGNGGIGGTTGGNGGDGTANLTLVNAATGMVGAFGGTGGWGLTNGGNGGNANASATMTNVNNGTFEAVGGHGGETYGTGSGGTGGNGTVTGSISGDVTGTFIGTGGNGGDNFGTGNGGNGGTGTVNATTVTGLLATDPVTNISTATGGNGGIGSGATFAGGNGGAGVINGPIEGISVSQTPGITGSGTVSVTATQIGGNGGDGTNNASGGTGAASTLLSNVVNHGLVSGVIVDGWTTGTLNLALNATGGNGGGADGVGLAQLGANGSATLINDQTGLAANEQAASLNGTATGIGGNGGSGTNGSLGVGGGLGTASAVMTGHHDVSATVIQTGGNGGNSDTINAGNGASEFVTPGTPDAIATSLGGGNVAASSTVTGGNGGTTLTGTAGNGGVALVIDDVAAVTSGGTATLTQNVIGGNGGDANGGTAGLGGTAISHLTFTDPANASTLTANVGATGGNGGNGLGGGSSGRDGGAVDLLANITGNNDVNVTGSMTGGNGGSTVDGSTAGNGASATNGVIPTTLVSGISTSAASVTVNASLTATGGNGGTSFGAGNGGTGGDAHLIDATTGAVGTGGGILALTQIANAGNGGGSTGGIAGLGGNATSILSTADATATDLRVTLSATAGNGGSGLGGGSNGNNGGTALVGGLVSGLDAVTVNANAQAGNGGDANGAGTFAATGTGISVFNPLTAGTGLITGTSINNGPVSVTTTETAGNGGNGTNGAFAGNGGNASVTNAVGGFSGGAVTLNQTANAGNGGNADTQNGGNGGNAVSNLTQTSLFASPFTGTSTANGGNGGISSGASNGAGGGAVATINLTSDNAVFATANANGGTGSSGGAATATATGSGASGLASANATTPGTGPVFQVQSHATGTIGSTTVANANTNIGGNVPNVSGVNPTGLMPAFAPGFSPNSFAFATGLPNAASVTAALAGPPAHPNNTAVWTQPTSFVAGAGLQGAAFNGTIGMSHTYHTETDYNFSVPFGKGTLLTVGLLNGDSFGTLSGVDSLTFQVTDNGVGVTPTSFSFLPAGVSVGANGIISFSTLAAADAFFSDDVLTFGSLAGTNTIGINLDLTAADAVGFQGNFLVGTAGPAGGGPAGVPEPGTLAIFFSALLGWFGIRLRQQKSETGARMA